METAIERPEIIVVAHIKVNLKWLDTLNKYNKSYEELNYGRIDYTKILCEKLDYTKILEDKMDYVKLLEDKINSVLGKRGQVVSIRAEYRGGE